MVSFEDVVYYLSDNDINFNRTQMRALVDIFEPPTGEIVNLEPELKDYVVRHMFNKNERQFYHQKHNSYTFADIVLRATL